MPSTRIETTAGWIADPAAAFEGSGLPCGDLKVIVHDAPRESWELGGKAATDIEVGFKVEV